MNNSNTPAFSPVNTSLNIHIVEDSQEAEKRGFSYHTTKGLKIIDAVVVKKGTSSGKSTVDLVLVDSDGNRYVTMITGALLKSIPFYDSSMESNLDLH